MIAFVTLRSRLQHKPSDHFGTSYIRAKHQITSKIKALSTRKFLFRYVLFVRKRLGVICSSKNARHQIEKC